MACGDEIRFMENDLWYFKTVYGTNKRRYMGIST